VRLILPLGRRVIPGSDAFDLVSPERYSSPIAQFEERRTNARCVLCCGENAA
jgi:hypothetical protein